MPPNKIFPETKHNKITYEISEEMRVLFSQIEISFEELARLEDRISSVLSAPRPEDVEALSMPERLSPLASQLQQVQRKVARLNSNIRNLIEKVQL